MTRIEPDIEQIKAAYNHRLNRPLSLEAMLNDPLQRLILINETRSFLRRNQSWFDAKKAQAGDKDEP